MRSLSILLLVIAGVGGMLLKNGMTEKAEVKTPAPTPAVSEHHWPKSALDRAAAVKAQVAQQRKEDETR
jgi:hypothetical protein